MGNCPISWTSLCSICASQIHKTSPISSDIGQLPIHQVHTQLQYSNNVCCHVHEGAVPCNRIFDSSPIGKALIHVYDVINSHSPSLLTSIIGAVHSVHVVIHV